MQLTLPNVIDAVKQANAGRLVLVSAFGAGDTAEKATVARLIYRTVLGKFFRDMAASDEVLMKSGLDYTIVYPGEPEGRPGAAGGGRQASGAGRQGAASAHPALRERGHRARGHRRRQRPVGGTGPDHDAEGMAARTMKVDT